VKDAEECRMQLYTRMNAGRRAIGSITRGRRWRETLLAQIDDFARTQAHYRGFKLVLRPNMLRALRLG